MSRSPSIVWFRRDLRLADQPALFAAAAAGAVIPVYVLDDDGAGDRKLGGASRWWLHHSLEALSSSLSRHHSKLTFKRGDAATEIEKLVQETGAREVHAIRHYEPWWQSAEGKLAGKVDLVVHDGNYLAPPLSVTTGSGAPYKVYTPFSRALLSVLLHGDVLDEPTIPSPDHWPQSDALADWGLLPEAPDWAGGLREVWEAGEGAARSALSDFLEKVSDYEDHRNLPSMEGTSRLSPHLHWGEISPKQVWSALAARRGKGADSFRRELIWRDYAQNVIAQFPDYPERSYRENVGRIEWRDPKRNETAASDLKAWQQGRTGYPIVDAGMRQLWRTGWMHNRVRMIAASFLVKHLLIDWRHGERWFWDTLVDADYANNGVNWQWVAGSGVDANMFVRIMAPLSQSEKFDAGSYIREWVPELSALSDAEIHEAPNGRERLGYPEPLIGHREARARALEAWSKVK